MAHVADEHGQAGFLSLVGDLGARAAGLAAELAVMQERLFSGRFVGLVPATPAPQRPGRRWALRALRLRDGRARRHRARRGIPQGAVPELLVFGLLPGDVADAATTAYEHVLEEEDVRLGREWDASVAAALACWVVGRWRLVREAIEDDREWGTSTIRPRLLVWLAAAAEAAGRRCRSSPPLATSFAKCSADAGTNPRRPCTCHSAETVPSHGHRPDGPMLTSHLRARAGRSQRSAAVVV